MKVDQPINPSFKKEEIDPHILNQLQKTDQEKLIYGKFTKFLKDYELPDGRIKDGKLRLIRADGKVKAEFIEKKPELVVENIPILGKKLSKDQIDKLEKGEIVKLSNYKGVDLFLQIDKELNQVTVNTSKQIGLIEKIGSYKLNEVDKELWMNNEKLPPRIFYNKENDSYFQARIRLKEDGKGIEYHDYKSIPDKEKAKDLIEKFNTEKMLSNTADLTKEAIGKSKIFQKEESKIKDNGIQKVSEIELTDSSFQKHLDTKDLNKIRMMADHGYKPESPKLNEMFNKSGFDEQQRRDVLVALKQDPKKFLNKFYNAGEQAMDKINNKLITIEKISEKGIATVKDLDGKEYKLGTENLKKSTTLDQIQTQQKGLGVGLPKKSHGQSL